MSGRVDPAAEPAEPAEPLHFIGIGGAGMSVVAELFLAGGHAVTGSDARASATLERLAGLGAVVHVGHARENVAGAGTVVVSTAVRPDNPELVAAREAGVPVLHRSAALALVARGQDFVAVAGAHGKTTTSAMLALALREAGEDPSYAIGGEVLALGSGAHAGTGRAFVAEADESDRSFLAYEPRVAVVTNIEADHLDHYASVAAVHEAFAAFAARIVPGGLLVACRDDDGAAHLAAAVAGRGGRVRTYGTSPVAAMPDGAMPDAGAGRAAGPAAATSDHVAVSVTDLRPDGSSAVLAWTAPGGAVARVAVDLAVPGEHNVLNATAAWCALVDLGVDPERAAACLGAFTGTRRRFEHRGVAGGVRVVDDYAHHPTEVAALLAQARLAAGPGRVLALFQPHLYSRTLTFAAEFGDALAAADEVVVTDVYGAREEPRPGVTSALITDAMAAAGAAARARYVPDRLAAAAAIVDAARPGDLVLTVGAGDVTELAGTILEQLATRG